MKHDRLKQMEQYIAMNEYVTVKELCERFRVHKNTVRSDINILAEKGIITKEYGGVSYNPGKIPSTFAERAAMHVEAKKEIGVLAAGLLEDGDAIFVDAGTTTEMLFNDRSLLPEHLMVFTSSLAVIDKCAELPEGINVYAFPGKLERELNCFADVSTVDLVRDCNFSKAFIGARGISEDGRLSSSSIMVAAIKKSAIANSRKIYLMAEADKVSNPAIACFGDLADVDYWICGRKIPRAEAIASEAGVEMVCVEE